MIDTRYCLICNKHNRTLYWHKDPDDGSLWCWCNACDRGYSIRSYCYQAGISLAEFLKGDFDFKESASNELQAMSWPARFVPLSDPRAQPGVDYVKSRGLTLEGDMYYDCDREGIVFPYYWGNYFVGAQTRFIKPRVHVDGDVQKIDTMVGTRLGILVYGWNQQKLIGNVKAVIICEGAFNSIAVNQALNRHYGGIANSPWRAVACSGSGATQHHREIFKELKEQGLKIIIAPDTDEAGMKMLKKYKEANVATHYALTGRTEDWNDVLREMGHEKFAKFFLSSIKKIESD